METEIKKGVSVLRADVVYLQTMDPETVRRHRKRTRERFNAMGMLLEEDQG
jgi:hypothetical protein